MVLFYLLALQRQFFFFIDLFLERERAEARGTEGEGRDSQTDSALYAEPSMGLKLTTLRSRSEQKPRVGGSMDHTTKAHPPPRHKDSFIGQNGPEW